MTKAENTGEGSLKLMCWNASQCAEAIGRTKYAVYNLVHRRRIPFHKPDGKLQFIPEEIRAWLTNGADKNVS